MPEAPRPPQYSLVEVQRVIHLGRIGRRVVLRTAGDYPAAEPEIENFIRAVIRSLTPDDFVERKEQVYEDRSIVADIYGVANDDGHWYVKFSMEHGRVTVLSCHAPEHDLRCVNGTKIKADS